MNQFGITEKSNKLLLETFSKYPQVQEVILFGSRAKGNFKKGSDIDLAIKGSQCSADLALTLQAIINEELPIPYKVDVIDYQSLDHHDLKSHIDRVGVQYYQQSIAEKSTTHD